MFTATIQDAAFQALLAGINTQVLYRDDMNDNSQFVEEVLSHTIPVDGTHWMILNGQKLLVQVSSNASDPDECPCCWWDETHFKLVS